MERQISGSANKLLLQALVVFALAMVGVSIASIANQLGREFPGFIVWKNLIVPSISAPSWPGDAGGLPFRTVVRAVDGTPVQDAAALRRHIRSVPLGTEVRYRFRSLTGNREVRSVPTAILTMRDVVPIFGIYLLNGLVLLGVALTVFYVKPENPAARSFLFLGVCLGGTLILAIDTLMSFWCSRLYFMLESLVPAALLLFAATFPQPKGLVLRFPQLRWWTLAAFAAVGVLQNALYLSNPLRHLAVNDWVYTAMAVSGLVLLASLLESFLHARTPLARQQVKTVLFGMGAAIFVPSLLMMAIILLRLDIPMNAAFPLLLLGPLSIGYAIARHDLFQVDRYVRNGIVYGAVSVLVFLGYAIVVFSAELALGAERALPANVIPFYLLFLVLVFNPLRARIQSIVDRVFYRQAYSYRATVQGMSRALSSFLNTEKVVAAVLAALTEVMAIEWATILVLSSRGNTLRVYGDSPNIRERVRAAFPPDGSSVGHLRGLEKAESSQAFAERCADPTEGCEAIAESHPALLVPARFEGANVAVILIGDKKSGAYYSEDDLDLLQTLADQAALALTNAEAYEIIRQTQADLVRSERLAAVGELAASVAHGIRNPLAGIRAAAQLAREDVAETSSDLREGIDDIISEADRLEMRVRSLLDFARPFEPNLRVADLGVLLDEFATSMRPRLAAGIELLLDVDPHLPRLGFYAAQLTEVMEALVINAAQAMGEHGTVSIQAHPTSDASGEPGVELHISDTGPGFAPGQLERIFSLFYTTKAQGTGIGLAMAQRIIERHRGRLSAESRDGGGATFSIYLPLAPGSTADAQPFRPA